MWSVPYFGTVVNGIVNAGSVKSGDAVLLGPDSNGNYQSTVIKSMQRKRSVWVILPVIMFSASSSHRILQSGRYESGCWAVRGSRP